MATAYISLWRVLQSEANIEQLIFEILGESQALGIRLPCDKPLSQLALARRLCVRLKLVFDSHRFIYIQPLATATISRNWILRIILFTLEICTSVHGSQHKLLDYLLFRRNALETLLSAVSVFLLSQSSLSIEEDDLLQASIQKLAESWRLVQALSHMEQALLDIMASALATLEDCDPENRFSIKPDTDSLFTIPLSVAMDQSRIQKSASQLIEAVSVEDPSAFFKAYHSISQALGMLFDVDPNHGEKNTALEKSFLMMRSLADIDKEGITTDLSTGLRTFLSEKFISGFAAINGMPKNEKSVETPMMERMKRFIKAEIPEFYSFCSRRQQSSLMLHSYPTPPYPASVQPRPHVDSAYGGTSSRPLSSISSTTYSTDGPQTPFRPQSPMSINDIIVNRPGRSASPDSLEMTPQKPHQLTRSQFRVRRKTLSSPRPTPDRIEETDYNDGDPPEQRNPLLLFGNDATATIPDLKNLQPNALVFQDQDAENMRPSPLQLRRPSANMETPSPIKLVRDGDQIDEQVTYDGAINIALLGPSSMAISIPRNPSQCQTDTLSPVSPEGTYLGVPDHSSRRPSLLHSSLQRAHSGDGLKAIPASISDAPGESREHDNGPWPQGSSDATTDLARTTFVKTPHAGTDSPRKQFSNIEDCTLELVNDLSSTDKRSAQAYCGSPESSIPGIIRQPYPTPYPVEKEIESGLEFAPEFIPPVIMRKYSYPHPERPDADSLSLRPSVKSSSSSKSRLRFLKRLGGTKEAELIPLLPPNLQASFSVCATSLLIWSKKDSNCIVQFRSPFTSGHKLDLATPKEPYSDPTDMPKGFSIRLVTGNAQIVVAYACSNKEYRLYAMCANGNQFSVLLGEGIPLATSLAVSLDDDLIALGCGSSVLIYRVHGELSQIYQVGTQIDSSAGSIRLQRLSFSTDSKRLLAATQVSTHTSDKQAIRFVIWERTGAQFQNIAQVDPVQLTMGYGADSGLTSVFQSLTASSQIFLAASVSKPYPSILSTDKETRPRHLNLADKRITFAAQCVTKALRSDQLFVIQSGHHKLFVVDVQTAITKQLVDFSSERRNIGLGREAMALGIASENEVYACWISADERLILKVISEGKVKSVDLTELYLQARGP